MKEVKYSQSHQMYSITVHGGPLNFILAQRLNNLKTVLKGAKRCKNIDFFIVLYFVYLFVSQEFPISVITIDAKMQYYCNNDLTRIVM